MVSAFEMAHDYDHEAHSRAAFIAALGHELRTPLMVLMGATDLLLRDTDDALTDEQRVLVEAMHRSAHTLTTLVNNALGRLKDEG
jgi:signal transduction histidine kinase